MTDDSAPPCLLSYAFSTVPSPIQASTAAAASPGLIEIWLSAGGGPVYCDKIVLAVPIGTGPHDLTATVPSVTPNTTWWVVSSSEKRRGREIGLRAETTYAVFSIDCVSSTHYQIAYQLILAVTIPMANLSTDTFDIGVVETSGTTSDRTQFQQRLGTFTLERAAAELYLDNFVAVSASVDSGTEPIGEFASNTAIRFEWEGNATSYALYAAARATPFWTGADTSYELVAGITTDTTFTVVATGTDADPAATAMATLPLTVSDAALAAAAVTVGTDLTATGLAQCQGVAANNTPPSATALTVTGTTTLAGQATMAATTLVSGQLTANGTTTIGNADAASLSVLSALAAFGAPVPVPIPGRYTATSDGLVLCVTSWPSDTTSQCLGYVGGNTVTGITPALDIAMAGGNSLAWTDGNRTIYVRGYGSTMVLPVAQGQFCGFSTEQTASTAAPMTCFWIPFGKGGVLNSRGDAADRAGLDVALSRFARPSVTIARPGVAREVAAVADAAVALFGPRATAALRRRLADVLLRVATA